jgi:eukaryotic-like serine/threonine-protein kinase
MDAAAADRFRRVDALFDAALEKAAGERADFLAAACEDDPALYDEVIALLETAATAESVIGEDIGAFAGELLASLGEAARVEETSLAAGARLGPWRIVGEIGRGGMGAVYLAARDDGQFEKRVALKLVKRGMDTDEVLRRFRAERQILAALEHPNIARLYDGGATEDGRPYLVMEHVDGIPIDTYCETHGLGVEARLALFASACGAVQHAHQSLVVHRDLKPSNVLVSGGGEVKLLDFGIAKLLDPAGEDLTPRTRTGLRVLTPEYAAPEQLRGEPATTAADVWALGVILYLLLTGQRPVAGAAGEATRPSLVARAEWRRRLRGDLDTIVRKALAPDSSRRYASAQHLLDDLERHRTGLPILARPPGLAYRAGKYVRRHRVGVAATGAALLALIMSSAAWAVRVTQERDTAHAERAAAEEVSRFLTDLFAASDPFAPGPERRDTLRARDLVRLGADRLRDDTHVAPALRARMLIVLGKVHQELALHDDAEALLREAVDVRRALHDHPHADLAEAIGALASLLHTRGRFDDAEPLAREALALRRAVHAPEEPAVAGALHALARLLMVNRELEEAETLQREAVDIQRRSLDRTDLALADGLSVLARILMAQGRNDEAEQIFRESALLRRDAHGDAHPLTAVGLIDLGLVLRRLERLDEAAAALVEADAINRAALGERHPHLVHNLNGLAFVRNAQGDFEEAGRLLERSIDIQQDYGDAPQLSVAWDAYAGVLEARGDLAGAERAQREALAVARRVHGDEHWAVGLMTVRVARRVHAAGSAPRALPLFRDGLALLERTRPPQDVDRAMARVGLGALLRDMGRYDEAEPHLRETYDLLAATRGTEDAFANRAREALAALYQAWGRAEDAARLSSAGPTDG